MSEEKFHCDHCECCLRVFRFFHKDVNKTWLWFATPNQLLGGISPTEMVYAGREKKLLQFIKTQIEENQL